MIKYQKWILVHSYHVVWCSVAFLSNLVSDEVYYLLLINLTQLIQGLDNELQCWVKYVWQEE